MTWKVELAVYDLSQGMAAQMSQAILGQQYVYLNCSNAVTD